MRRAFDMARQVASSSATVLITGESGTGKEVVARLIHRTGNRAKGPFVAINCSAIPEALLESELFGYAKGAFTGAADRRRGLFEEAEGGILFLDEIGDLASSLQPKLLRVLQERKIRRVGENEFKRVNVRVLAATHCDLSTEVKEKRFREDLFFRLNVIPIHVPSLKERVEDIAPLAEQFVERFAAENGVIRKLTPEALRCLESMSWRGNVRELENTLERAVVLSQHEEIGIEHLPGQQQFASHVIEFPSLQKPPSLDVASIRPLNEIILDYVAWVLAQVGGIKEQAARILGVDRKTLYRRVQELELRQGKTQEKEAA